MYAAASTSTHENPFLATSQAYSTFTPPWNITSYETVPPSNISWPMQNWIPDMDYSSRMASRPESYQYTQPNGPPVFAQPSSPYHQSQGLGNAGLQYGASASYGQYFGSQSQTPGITSVSPPTSTSYFQGHFQGSR